MCLPQDKGQRLFREQQHWLREHCIRQYPGELMVVSCHIVPSSTASRYGDQWWPCSCCGIQWQSIWLHPPRLFKQIAYVCMFVQCVQGFCYTYECWAFRGNSRYWHQSWSRIDRPLDSVQRHEHPQKPSKQCQLLLHDANGSLDKEKEQGVNEREEKVFLFFGSKIKVIHRRTRKRLGLGGLRATLHHEVVWYRCAPPADWQIGLLECHVHLEKRDENIFSNDMNRCRIITMFHVAIATAHV